MATETKASLVAPIATIFATNELLVRLALEGLTTEQVWRAPTSRNNPMLWILGHLVHTRAELLALLGAPIETGWGERFARGATVGKPAGYPSRDEIEPMMRESS